MIDPFRYTQEKYPFLALSDIINLLKSSEVMRLKAGEVFIKQGDLNYNSAFVLNGMLRAYCLTTDGKEKTVLFRKEREWIGSIPCMIYGEEATEQVEAVEDSILFYFDFRNFRTLASKNTRVSRAYSQMIEDMLKEAIERIQDFTVLTPEERYLKFETENKMLMQRIPLKYLASYLGVTIPSLSRIRARVAK